MWFLSPMNSTLLMFFGLSFALSLYLLWRRLMTFLEQNHSGLFLLSAQLFWPVCKDCWTQQAALVHMWSIICSVLFPNPFIKMSSRAWLFFVFQAAYVIVSQPEAICSPWWTPYLSENVSVVKALVSGCWRTMCSLSKRTSWGWGTPSQKPCIKVYESTLQLVVNPTVSQSAVSMLVFHRTRNSTLISLMHCSLLIVCKKYLLQYPGDTDLLWEVESIGAPNQRTNIANKIQGMDLSGKKQLYCRALPWNHPGQCAAKDLKPQRMYFQSSWKCQMSHVMTRQLLVYSTNLHVLLCFSAVSRSLSFTEDSLVMTEVTEEDVVMEAITTQIKEAESMKCTVEIVVQYYYYFFQIKIYLKRISL